ncbi:hypothetical protein EHV15_11240 [Paenibacillus oralis]|uniref:DUF3139 domain-containing protein n=1 Tax=Paenibacillus oralis TaxID=2490856 RepID=A0A3P3U4D0_9BACL|nr:hypothetical protein [Paenibacillus oralis]RRJ63433.1 hypothetical protein EHV15_11240 [Paenibacillus oralis]
MSQQKVMRWIFSILLIAGTGIIAVVIYFGVNGTPWGKKSFGLTVEEYLNSKDPNIKIISQEVRYSVVDMRYHSTVCTESGEKFEVSIGYNNELEDN